MKKLFTFIIPMLMGVPTLHAQDFPLQFVDSQGNVVVDGTVLQLTTIEDLGYGDVQIPSGLSVENKTSEEVTCGTEYSITALPNGAFQTCFPTNCVMRETTGSWTSETGTMKGNEKRNMLTEWLPISDGTTVAEFQLLKYKINPVTKKPSLDTRGPKVTLNFVYDPSHIHHTDVSAAISTVEYFTLDGRRISHPSHGVYVSRITYVNGAVKTQKQQF
jgi:hypothetical protein